MTNSRCRISPAGPFDILDLDGVPPRPEPELTIQHSRRDDGQLHAVFSVTLIATLV
ncbi:MAG TPA: hypothetical protein VGW77_14520 [Candidatus Binatia bacterium]|nr:hypothetical protein [Candidatus Binatia bacterium]